MPDPRVTYVGPVAIWWIPKPRGPRASIRNVGLAWAITLPLTALTLLSIHEQAKPLWPFGREITSPTQMVLRYELILGVYLTYVTFRSLPGWLRYRRWAKRDVRAIDAAIREERWESAALLVHRYCLMVSGLWRRVPARVTAWDSVLRKRLTRHRRLYVYYRDVPPPVPPDPAVSFTPAVIPPPQPSWWSLLGLIPLALLLAVLFTEVRRQQKWELMLTFNVMLLTAVLISYSVYFSLAVLGRSHYFRLAPGIVQRVKFTVRRRHPMIETFELRAYDGVLDLASSRLQLSLIDAVGRQFKSFRFPRGDDVVDAIFRTLLSTAPSPPLSEEQLVD